MRPHMASSLDFLGNIPRTDLSQTRNCQQSSLTIQLSIAQPRRADGIPEKADENRDSIDLKCPKDFG